MKLIKLVLTGVESEYVEFQTGTCELCFGSGSGNEETVSFDVFEVGKDENHILDTPVKLGSIEVDAFYYTAWENDLRSIWVDNWVSFGEWLSSKYLWFDEKKDISMSYEKLDELVDIYDRYHQKELEISLNS